MPNKKRKVIMFENGSVGFADEGHDFKLAASNGSEIKKVNERELTPEERKAEQNPKLMRAEHKNGKWQIREKTLDEKVNEKLITVAEAEELAKKSKGKAENREA